MNNFKNNILYKAVAFLIVFTFGTALPVPLVTTEVHAQGAFTLPAPGTMVPMSVSYTPAIITGVTIYPNDPLQFDFIIDTGDDKLQDEALRKESQKLIKYFMASLTVPEDEMWVNLSPYEKDRIIANGLGQTEMGVDMLAQDYILKQLTASLMYPEDELGKELWDKVYRKANEKYSTSEIPMNTFNKVWIVPDTASIYVNAKSPEKGISAFVVESHLKVMLEEDYLALESNIKSTKHGVGAIPDDEVKEISAVTSGVVQKVLIPEIEKEVNEGKNFATLRQIFHSMILASWYKENLKESLLGQVYIDQNKINGIDIEDKESKQKIYDQYIEAYKKGVYDFIKEDYDETTQQIIPRKYFSGGIDATGQQRRRVAPTQAWVDRNESRDIVSERVRLKGEGPAMRRSGQGFTKEQEQIVDAVIALYFDPENPLSKTRRSYAEFVAEGNPSLHEDVEAFLEANNMSISIQPGLDGYIQQATLEYLPSDPVIDFMTHPGRSRRQLNMSDSHYLEIASNNREYQMAWVKHELAHIENPTLDEEAIQAIAPLPENRFNSLFGGQLNQQYLQAISERINPEGEKNENKATLYLFSGPDISTALEATDAETVVLVDAMPFYNDNQVNIASILRKKSEMGFYSVFLREYAQSDMWSLINEELSIMGAQLIEGPATERDQPRYELKVSYKGKERKIVYVNRTIQGEADLDVIKSYFPGLSFDFLLLKAPVGFNGDLANDQIMTPSFSTKLLTDLMSEGAYAITDRGWYFAGDDAFVLPMVDQIYPSQQMVDLQQRRSLFGYPLDAPWAFLFQRKTTPSDETSRRFHYSDSVDRGEQPKTFGPHKMDSGIEYSRVKQSFQVGYEAALNLKAEGEKVEPIDGNESNQQAIGLADLVNISLRRLEELSQTLPRGDPLREHIEDLLARADNNLDRSILIRVAQNLGVNAVRYFNREKGQVELIFDQEFIDDLLGVREIHPEAVSLILAERLFHELGHRNETGTNGQERVEEREQILKDMFLNNLMMSQHREIIDAFFVSNQHRFESGYYFRFLASLQSLSEADRDQVIERYLTNNYPSKTNSDFAKAMARKAIENVFGPKIKLEDLIKGIAAGDISEFQFSTGVNVEQAFLLSYVMTQLYPHIDFNLAIDFIQSMTVNELLQKNSGVFATRSDAESWLENLIVFIKAYSKKIFLEEDLNYSELQNLKKLVDARVMRSDREIRAVLSDGTSVLIGPEWSTDGERLTGKTLEEPSEEIELSWREVKAVLEAHKKDSVEEWLNKNFDSEKSYGIKLSPATRRILAENIGLMVWYPNIYVQLGGTTRRQLDEWGVVVESKYYRRSPRLYTGLVGMTENNFLYQLLSRYLNRDNPGREFSRDEVASYVEHILGNLARNYRERLLRPTSSFLSSFFAGNTEGVTIHPLDDVREVLDSDFARDLEEDERTIIHEIIGEVRQEAEAIGDIEMVEYLSQFGTPDQLERVKTQMLFDVYGLAVNSRGQRSLIVLDEIMLFLALRGIPGVRTTLKKVFIHEAQHSIDHENNRLPLDADSDIKERSAQIRTSAYYNGYVKTDGRRFVVFYKYSDDRISMETTKDSLMPASREDYRAPEAKDEEAANDYYVNALFEPVPTGQLQVLIKGGKVDSENILWVQTTGGGEVTLTPGWSFDKFWTVNGQDESNGDHQVGWKEMAAFKVISPDGDSAMFASTSSPVGGIDFNPGILDMQVGGDVDKAILSIPRKPFLQNININGFSPVIINITPVSNFTLLLGLASEDKIEQQLSLVY